MSGKREATVDDLSRVDGKAELVNGKIVMMSPAGGLHGYAGGQIFVSLHEYCHRTNYGVALPDCVGFVVNLSHRRSFSPDVAVHVGEPLSGDFIQGAPVFAVEVRSRREYGPAALRRMAAKRADYFAAGTLVVWDVDVLRGECVHVYRAADPDHPTTYHRTQIADAAPAVPGWTMAVEDLLPKRS